MGYGSPELCNRSIVMALAPPCPSCPCFFGIPCFFSLRRIPWFFECFALLFQGYQGFGRDKKSLFFWWFSLPFSKKTGGLSIFPIDVADCRFSTNSSSLRARPSSSRSNGSWNRFTRGALRMHVQGQSLDLVEVS